MDCNVVLGEGVTLFLDPVVHVVSVSDEAEVVTVTVLVLDFIDVRVIVSFSASPSLPTKL